MVPFALLVVKETEPASLWHNAISSSTFICPFGLTVIVNVFAGPVQSISPLLYKGVTVIVAVTGMIPPFTALNKAMFPVPDAARLIEGSLLVHE